MFEEKYGRHPLKQSQNPFTCGITGITYTALEMANRVELLSKGLARELGWYPNEGNEWKKVAGIFSLNTVDYMTVVYAVHRLSGIVTPVSPTSSSSQLEHQLRASGAKALFTVSNSPKNELSETNDAHSLVCAPYGEELQSSQSGRYSG